VAQLRQIVEAVGVDHGQRRGEQFIGLVVVDHDDVEAELARLEHGLMAGGAAIDRDQQRRSARGERADRFCIRSVAFEQAIRNMDDRTNAAVQQVSPQHRSRRRPIHIVVAQDGDRFRAHDGVRQPHGRRPHVGERVGIRHQRAHGRIEEACYRVHLDPAPGENAREKLGHVIVALRNRERTGGTALIEPIAPRAAAGRALDAEEHAPGRAYRCCEGDRHLAPGRIAFKKAYDTG
jgi:hypothetical protein